MLKSLLGKSDATCAVNKLVKLNIDSDTAYRQAAELVKDRTIKDMFLKHADQRAEFARELAAQVRELGGEPATSGSLINKVMIPLRMAFFKLTKADDAKLVSAAESAEDCSRDAYAKALKNQDLRPETRGIIDRQMSGLQQSHNRVRALELQSQASEIPDATV